MPLRTRLLSTVAASAALLATATTLTAVPALSAAPTTKRCQVSGGSSSGDVPNEWAVIVTFRSKGVSCAQAKAVVTQCASRDSVPGWKFTKKPSDRFINRANPKRRFVVTGAGGQPQCISKAYGY